MDGLSIGQLASAAGIPVSTVRFYERSGLLKPDFRTGANYRGYSPASAQRLRFIVAAKGTGFSLNDIKEMLALTDFTDPPCKEVEALMAKRLTEIRQRIKELRRVERSLAKSRRECCKGKGFDVCDEIGRLNGKRRTSDANKICCTS